MNILNPNRIGSWKLNVGCWTFIVVHGPSAPLRDLTRMAGQKEL